MKRHLLAIGALVAVLFIPRASLGQTISLDTTEVRTGPITVTSAENTVTVT